MTKRTYPKATRASRVFVPSADAAKPNKRRPGDLERAFQSLDAADDEHPVDRMVSAIPAIRRLYWKTRRLSDDVRAAVPDRKLFVRFEDAMSEHRARREEVYFGFGFKHGVLVGLEGKRRQVALTGHLGTIVRHVHVAALDKKISRSRLAAVLLDSARAIVLASDLEEARLTAPATTAHGGPKAPRSSQGR